MAVDDSLERLLGRPIDQAARAEWGFQNRTDIVTLAGGERVVVQRYRRREDADYRLRAMRGLWAPAAAAGIAIPRARDADLDADPPWVLFDALPGVPVPEAAGLEHPGFPDVARSMGELLAAFRELPTAGLEPYDLWAHPARLARRASGWSEQVASLTAEERRGLAELIDRVPGLFAGRAAVLAHGDFAPVNVMTDGEALTGLLDFESVRLADPLFDPAWWAWSVSFAPPTVLKAAWPAFLDGAGVDADEPQLAERVRALQVLRMLELLAGDSLDDGVRDIVVERLARTLHS